VPRGRCIYGSNWVSRLAPGTHLKAHCGPSNFKLRLHLGVVVPAGCAIRVGSEWHEQPTARTSSHALSAPCVRSFTVWCGVCTLCGAGTSGGRGSASSLTNHMRYHRTDATSRVLRTASEPPAFDSLRRQHEVRHGGDGERIVLICDLWHPDLDVEGAVLQNCTAEQLEAVHAAREGRHLPKR
jgi:hypothetical protein